MIFTTISNSSAGWPRKKMGGRVIICGGLILLSFFPAGNPAAKEERKEPDLDFLQFLEAFEGPGGKAFDPLDLMAFREERKAPKKPPPGKSAEEKNERKGNQR